MNADIKSKVANLTLEVTAMLKTIEAIKGKKYARAISVAFNIYNAHHMSVELYCEEIPQKVRDAAEKLGILALSEYIESVLILLYPDDDHESNALCDEFRVNLISLLDKQDEYNNGKV